MLNVALIGAGRFGKNHIRVINGNKNSKLCCVVDNVYRDYIDPNIYLKNFYEFIELKNKMQIDCAIVATPANMHCNMASNLLGNEVHVLCEKPLSLTECGAFVLHKIANKNNLVLKTGYTFLNNSVFKEIEKIFNSKEFGKPIAFFSTRNNYGPIREDVGVIYDLMTHDIAILSSLLECLPTEIQTNKMNFNSNRYEDIATINMKYDDMGFFASCSATWLCPVKERTIKIIGSKMMIEWIDGDKFPLRLYYAPKEFSDYREYSDFLLNSSSTYKEMICPTILEKEPLSVQFDDFITDCVENSVGKYEKIDSIVSHILERANNDD